MDWFRLLRFGVKKSQSEKRTPFWGNERKNSTRRFLWPFLQFSHKRVNLSYYKSMLILNSKNSARVTQNTFAVFEMSQSSAQMQKQKSFEMQSDCPK